MGQSRIKFTDESIQAMKDGIEAVIGVMSLFEDYKGGEITVDPLFQARAVGFFKDILPKLTIEFQQPSGLVGMMHSVGFKEDIDRQIKEMADRGEKPKSAWDVVSCFVSSTK